MVKQNYKPRMIDVKVKDDCIKCKKQVQKDDTLRARITRRIVNAAASGSTQSSVDKADKRGNRGITYVSYTDRC